MQSVCNSLCSINSTEDHVFPWSKMCAQEKGESGAKGLLASFPSLQIESKRQMKLKCDPIVWCILEPGKSEIMNIPLKEYVKMNN